MKKGVKLLSVMLSVLLIVSLFSACSPNGKAIMTDTYSGFENLALQSVTIKPDGKENASFSLKGKAEENNYVTVDLGKQTDLIQLCLRKTAKR